MKNKTEWWKAKAGVGKDVWSMVVWFAIGWGAVTLGEWMLPGFGVGQVQAFFVGAGAMFVALTALGAWKQNQIIVQNALAKAQWDKDREADMEQQAQIDQEIINKLKNDHSTLSGKEQDKRLLALEAALKHLRKQ